MKELSWPDLLIAGAPKSGTTTLHELLVTSPNIVDWGKDVYAMADPAASGLGGRPGPVRRCEAAHVSLESGASYMYMGSLTSRLGSNRSGRVVIILREPTERLLSTYRYFSNNKAVQQVRGQSFADFVEASRDGRIRERDITIRDAYDHGFYERYLEPWSRALGSRLRVLSFGDLGRDSLGLAQDVAAWAGVERLLLPIQTMQSNATRAVRSGALHRLVRRAAPLVAGRSEWTRTRVLAAYERLNGASSFRPLSSRDEAMLDDLRAAYAPTVDYVRERFDIDLSPRGGLE